MVKSGCYSSIAILVILYIIGVFIDIFNWLFIFSFQINSSFLNISILPQFIFYFSSFSLFQLL